MRAETNFYNNHKQVGEVNFLYDCKVGQIIELTVRNEEGLLPILLTEFLQIVEIEPDHVNLSENKISRFVYLKQDLLESDKK